MSQPILEEIRDLAERIRHLEVDLEDSINTARDLGHTAQEINEILWSVQR